MITGCILAACTPDSEDPVPDHLLSEEEGKYIIHVVSSLDGDEVGHMPSFYRELDDSTIMEVISQVAIDSNEPPDVFQDYIEEGEEMPYFIFTDDDQIVFGTSDESEAYDFVQEKASETE